MARSLRTSPAMRQEAVEDLPRERALVRGLESVADEDLLAMVLGTGIAKLPALVLAREVLEEVGGVAGLARLSPAALCELRGLGPARAMRICSGFELARRATTLTSQPRPKLSTSSEVAAYAARLAALDHEEMWLIALDGQNGARGFKRVAQGGLHGCSVSARDILRTALREAASAIVLVHNHPSGDPTPSVEDIGMTRVVAEAADVVGVALVDHVILGARSHASLLDLGLLG